MNNRNWIAVFLGLACLVLFVSVMGASGNWLNNNNAGNNNGTNPQQINQTIRDMNKAPQDNTVPTEIDANQITNDMTDKDNKTSSNTSNTTNNTDNSKMNMPSMLIPKIAQ